jgi:hypothetical protein
MNSAFFITSREYPGPDLLIDHGFAFRHECPIKIYCYTIYLITFPIPPGACQFILKVSSPSS